MSHRIFLACRAFAVVPALIIGGLQLGGCGETVDCGALCDRTMACEVTFDAPDDPAGEQINDGSRSPRDACVLGCQAHPVVDVETAGCVDALDTRDPNVCQAQVLSCFDLD